ncbi:hypothetical protein OFO01_03920 [Campylobacter sp. JMF_01 NE2]|uniref:hypothetical protein n=1 Tax=unclassified Campylobacter TaxID=2593542 RepID=UPI0022E9E0EE|nr:MULTISPECIES: hypothetical protein [unclassified Campylobacter]MDA3052593.1 hypothetical protein [Campylobacter sp. JMF_03 NE3]MDA3066925.1 hypothetical protein [Campylobacter sp. JMF_01 NE2]
MGEILLKFRFANLKYCAENLKFCFYDIAPEILLLSVIASPLCGRGNLQNPNH